MIGTARVGGLTGFPPFSVAKYGPFGGRFLLTASPGTVFLLDVTVPGDTNTIGGFMRKRSKMTKRGSRKLFRRTASKSHKRNSRPRVMRGGIRF